MKNFVFTSLLGLVLLFGQTALVSAATATSEIVRTYDDTKTPGFIDGVLSYGTCEQSSQSSEKYCYIIKGITYNGLTRYIKESQVNTTSDAVKNSPLWAKAKKGTPVMIDMTYTEDYSGDEMIISVLSISPITSKLGKGQISYLVLKNGKLLDLEFRSSSDQPLYAKEVSEKDYKEASNSIKKMASLVGLEYPNQIQDLFDMLSNNNSSISKVVYSGLPEQDALAISYLQNTIITKQQRILYVLGKAMYLYLDPDTNTKIEDYTAYQDFVVLRDELKILTMTPKQYATMKNSTVREISEAIGVSRKKYRKEIAESAGISDYKGTREQNMRIKKGLLSVIKVTK